ncbi:MAG TPA: aldehyde dehydrogenase [Plasticicumulans sp.]|nr:aldehyde dehydrogenase [Plasticicumulans sp.]
MSTPPTLADWHARAAALQPLKQLLIDGRWQDAADGATLPCVNPASGQTWTSVAAGSSADIDRAVRAARAAFEDRRWAGQAPAARKRVLQRWAELVEAHRDELALLETLNVGKPIRDALAIDVPATARCLRWYGEAIDKLYDEIAPTAEQSLALIRREPVGVVGVVVPWNFPLIMSAWKLGPALAAGNSVVLKPAEQSPLSALKLAELALEAGLPPGVLNVVTGYGHSAGRALGLHEDVDAVGFTGSTEVGKLFLQYAGQSNLKRVWLECGGKTPHIILADCPDLDAAATAAAWGIFFNQGEMCTAGSRLLVDRRIKDQVLERIVAVGRTLAPGDPLDPATQIGAIVSKEQWQRVLDYIDIGRAQGATLALGGAATRGATGGFYIEPTVFDGVNNAMRIAQEEIFGPVLSVLAVDGAEQAVRIANDTMYGLAAAVWTRDLATAHRVSRQLRAGLVWVNCFDADDITTPFGGYRQSGNGRDKSLHAFDKYTELKTIWMRIGD